MTVNWLPRAAHWSLWVAAGVVCGLGLGFLLGLAKPRVRNNVGTGSTGRGKVAR